MLRFSGMLACVTVLIAAAVSAQTPQSQQAVSAASGTNKTPVLVELFTSEGCSSCPPADNLLARLDREQPVGSARIIVLEEHVDYWDQDGWHDRFASHEFTERQTVYGFHLNVKSIYTPEMIVDGTTEFVGNDGMHALHAISDATATTKLGLTVAQPSVDGRRVSSSVAVAGAVPQQIKGDIYAVLVDDSDATNVRAGENSGKRLEHVSVVRCLQKVGSAKQLASGPVTFALNAPEGSQPTSMKLVVFAQRGGQGAVFGAAEVPVAP